jgi:hypothetical protein
MHKVWQVKHEKHLFIHRVKASEGGYAFEYQSVWYK